MGHVEQVAEGRTWPDRVLGLSALVTCFLLGIRLAGGL